MVWKTIIQTISQKRLYKQFLWFFVVINQINKHEAKIYNHCTYTQIIIKKILIFFFIKYKNGENNHRFWWKKYHRKRIYSNDNKKIFNIDNVNINEILISKGLFPRLNHTYFVIGYDHNQKIKPLYTKLSKYVCTGTTFKKNLTISSEINDSYFFWKMH